MASPTAPDDAELIDRARIRDLPADPADGLFCAESWLRRVSAEPVILLGGARALLLEIAHPVVAIGVAEHSDFRRDPFGRLQRTLGAMTAITFKDRPTALAAVRAIERTHARVHGSFPRNVGRYRAGMRYDARDPEAMCWVWATLVDTALAVYRCFVADLPEDASADYYADQLAIARLLGIPEALLPATWEDFEAWFATMVEGDALVVDELACEIAAGVLNPPGGTANAKLMRVLSSALLPERLRVAYGLDWGAAKAARFEALVQSVRGLRGRSRAVDAAGDPR